jgi:hypothetical protein
MYGFIPDTASAGAQISGANCVHLFARGHWLDAPFGAPLPSVFSGEKDQTKLGRGSVARMNLFILPREVKRSGEGGPRSCAVEGAC